MGMPRHGAATSDSYGPSLGRGMGAGDRERQVTNGSLQPSGMQAMPGMQHGGGSASIAPNANSVPGFPQDAFMEGPMMNMDKAVAKPETLGPAGGLERVRAGHDDAGARAAG